MSAQPLPCGGCARVRGVVLDVRHGMGLLDLPYGRWCPFDTTRYLLAHSGATGSNRRLAG